jgi:thymidine kinase
MFVEPTIENGTLGNDKNGWVEVVCGSMFSGKTEELIRRVKRAMIAKQRVLIFKPGIDNRYHAENVVSHNDNSIQSKAVNFANDILLQANECDVVGIDEVQFFDDEIINVVNKLANNGKRVIIAGLDMDFAGRPFGPMAGLLAIAEFVTKVHAICIKCGNIATYSYRRTKSSKKVVLGETDIYEARCRKCFVEGMNEK